MIQRFPELRERLLREGVAPRHVSRYVAELADHFDDLTRAGEGEGLTPDEAKARARTQLGSTEELVRAMVEHREFQGWCVRAPWAVFSLGTLLLAAGIYFVAMLILWSGWRWFLPEAGTPFVKVSGAAMLYFGLGRLLYFAAPVFAGWGMVWLAIRQRMAAGWVLAGSGMTALCAAMVQVQAFRDARGAAVVGARLSPGLFMNAEACALRVLIVVTLVALGYRTAWSVVARELAAD